MTLICEVIQHFLSRVMALDKDKILYSRVRKVFITYFECFHPRKKSRTPKLQLGLQLLIKLNSTQYMVHVRLSKHTLIRIWDGKHTFIRIWGITISPT